MRFLAGAILLRDLGQDLLEVRRLAEITVNRRESHIGNGIEPAQGLAHDLTDRRGGDLRLTRAFELPDDARYQAIDPLLLDGPLAQRDLDGSQQLVTIERNFAARPFYDGNLSQLHALERREPAAAIWAHPPPADGCILLR